MNKYHVTNTTLDGNPHLLNILEFIKDNELPYLKGHTINDNIKAEVYNRFYGYILELYNSVFKGNKDVPNISYKYVDAKNDFLNRHEFNIRTGVEGTYKSKTFDKFNRHGLNILVDKRGITLFFGSKLIPYNPTVIVHVADNIKSKIVRGDLILRNIWKTKFKCQTSGLEMLHPDIIDQSIKTNVETLHGAVKRLPFDKDLKPALVNHHISKTITQLFHLMTLVTARQKIETIRTLNSKPEYRNEILERAYDNVMNGDNAVYFTEAVLERCGFWVEELLDNDFEALLGALRRGDV